MTPKRLLIGLGIVVVLGAIGYANFRYRRTTGTAVTMEKITRRDLEAIVSASGTIQPKRLVNISADTMGRVVDLAVTEGETVKRGQFLMQVDPRTLQTQVQNQEASLAGARSGLEETRRAVESSHIALTQAQAAFNRQEGLFKQGLTSRETYENAQNSLRMQEATVAQGEQSLKTQQTRISQQEALLDSAQYDLTKVRITSPIDGIITKRNIEEGETVVVGTMNNAGTVLLTVADMSVIQAEIEVDETDIPSVRIGQRATISIDAIPDKTFTGTVTEVGRSATAAAGTTNGRATNFKVVVGIDGQIPDVSPGFTCTATITTAKKPKVVAVPIQAMTVREFIVNEQGEIVKPPARSTPSTSNAAPAAPVELKPGQTRKEFEGVFLSKDMHAAFTPVKTGIAGDKYFEVASGLAEGDQVITGPFASVRTLKDGDAVVLETTAGASKN